MDSLSYIEQLLREQPRKPPVEQWHPALSGDIDINIDARGDWYHEGARIERQSLINLFASILRRESDGEYYLVTPVEKWRIRVEAKPLLVVDMEIGSDASGQKVLFLLNTDEKFLLDAPHPLTVDVQGDAAEPLPWLQLDRGLSARLTRSLFYRLVAAAEQREHEVGIVSCGAWFSLGHCE